MSRWIYDVPNFIPWDFPTPEDEHNETLDYLEKRMDSKAYNIIEGIHQIWLLSICDLIIGKQEYSVT